MARQIVVEIVGDASKFSKSTQEAIDGTTSLTGKLKNVGKGMVIGAGIASFNLLTDAIGIGIGKLGEAKDAFEADQVSQAKLAQALKNNIPNWDGSTAAVEKYALAQESLGFSDDEVRDSIGQLIGVTHDLTEAQKLNSIAQDLARAKGIDLATATDAVNKAYNGQGKALKALGVDIGDAKTGAELLAAAQDNVRGSAEAWAATNEGKLAVSNQKVGEAMERIGGVISQVASVVLPILADAFVVIVDVLGQVWDAIQPVVSAFVNALIPVVKRLLPIFQTVFGAVMNIIKALAPGFKIVFGIIGVIIGNFVTGIETAVKIVTAVIDVLAKVFQGIGNVVRAVFNGIGGIIRGVINAIINVINSVIRGINSFRIPRIEIAGNVIFQGWNGLNLRQIPRFHSGGVVPGSPGSEVLTVLQAGETVSPAGQVGQTVIINIDSFIGSDSDIDRFANKVAMRLHTAT